MDRDFIEEARNGDQETRTLIAIEALMKDPTVKHRHLRKALRDRKSTRLNSSH